ncbi:hypothetical protein [Oscillibacter sp. MSJ-31]|uniref:hypothetical protein n=1 Tax=Oscillibacter sp. MSJ-31 TaxID=2841526 RepID=UPI001C121F1C|nr:hypothetical protein [Oscillibacter sp. MSJ-31]MBU5458351.1 hypothetical protein [Oscillibacter sp. MSJ-31]
MKQTINKRLTLWLLTLVLAVAALPALTAPAQAAEKTPVDVVFGSETVKGEKETPYTTTFVCPEAHREERQVHLHHAYGQGHSQGQLR